MHLLFNDGPLAGRGLTIPHPAKDEYVAFLAHDGLVGVASPDHLAVDYEKVIADAPWIAAMALYRKTGEAPDTAIYRAAP